MSKSYHNRDRSTQTQKMLDRLMSGWATSIELAELTGSQNVQARLAGIRSTHKLISRDSQTLSCKEYRVTRLLTEEERERAQRAPKRVWIQVPEGCPAWAVEQAKRDARLFMEDQVEDEAPEEEVLDLVDGLDLW